MPWRVDHYVAAAEVCGSVRASALEHDGTLRSVRHQSEDRPQMVAAVRGRWLSGTDLTSGHLKRHLPLEFAQMKSPTCVAIADGTSTWNQWARRESNPRPLVLQIRAARSNHFRATLRIADQCIGSSTQWYGRT